MNCSCFLDLGCFLPNDSIDFGFTAFEAGDFTFEITYRGRTERIVVTFALNDPIVLPYTFDEIGEIQIKIQIPSTVAVPISGFNYLTSTGGACVFVINGAAPSC